MPNSLELLSSTNPHINALHQTSVKLHQAVREAAQAVRNAFADADQKDVHFVIRVTGRTHGDLKVTYHIGSDYSDKAEGYTMDVATVEYLRRHAWDKKHKPELISYTGETKVDEVF